MFPHSNCLEWQTLQSVCPCVRDCLSSHVESLVPRWILTTYRKNSGAERWESPTFSVLSIPPSRRLLQEDLIVVQLAARVNASVGRHQLLSGFVSNLTNTATRMFCHARMYSLMIVETVVGKHTVES